VGGGQKTDVDRVLHGASQPPKSFSFDDPKEFGLKGQGHVPDFIEEQRSPAGNFQESAFQSGGIGEGALFVAEQFAFQHRFGKGAAFD
jgi:hypothetical protein